MSTGEFRLPYDLPREHRGGFDSRRVSTTVCCGGVDSGMLRDKLTRVGRAVVVREPLLSRRWVS